MTPFEYKPHNTWDAPIDPERCKASVTTLGMRFAFHQCQRKATKDGWCYQHHPNAVADRRQESVNAYRRKMANRPIVKARNQLAELRQVCRALLDQYDDEIHYYAHFPAHKLANGMDAIRLLVKEGMQ